MSNVAERADSINKLWHVVAHFSEKGALWSYKHTRLLLWTTRRKYKNAKGPLAVVKCSTWPVCTCIIDSWCSFLWCDFLLAMSPCEVVHRASLQARTLPPSMLWTSQYKSTVISRNAWRTISRWERLWKIALFHIYHNLEVTPTPMDSWLWQTVLAFVFIPGLVMYFIFIFVALFGPRRQCCLFVLVVSNKKVAGNNYSSRYKHLDLYCRMLSFGRFFRRVDRTKGRLNINLPWLLFSFVGMLRTSTFRPCLEVRMHVDLLVSLSFGNSLLILWPAVQSSRQIRKPIWLDEVSGWY